MLRFALAVLLLCPGPAFAANGGVTIDGVARAASLMQAIGENCVPFGADAEQAEKFGKAFADAGAEAYGAQFASLLSRETARRRSEIAAQGAENWCAGQKKRQKKIGAGILFGTRH